MTLMRATDAIGRPVVTVDGGEAIAEIKDVVYSMAAGRLLGFTLNRRGFLAGPMKAVLPWSSVRALGQDALMIYDEGALAGPGTDAAQEVHGGSDYNVIGADVITDDGQRLGKVIDVVVHIDGSADVVGYEIDTDDRDRSVFVPLPDTLSLSGETLLVPAVVRDFLADDLAGFGLSVESFRDHLRGEVS